MDGLEAHQRAVSRVRDGRAAHARGEGCQIDLLIQTRRAVWVVEIKRRRGIGMEVVDEVAEKG